jgi:son of sevenless-like protein
MLITVIDVIRWVATEIISTPNLRKRMSVLKHFVSIASYSLRLNNFNAVFEIMAGLNMGSVRRLAQTWNVRLSLVFYLQLKGLSARTLEVLLVLEEFIGSDENWKTYRWTVDRAKSQKQPLLPYLGITLKVQINYYTIYIL